MAADRRYRVAIVLDAEGKAFIGEFDQATGKVRDLTGATEKLEQSQRKAGRQSDSFTRNISSLQKGAAGAVRILGGMAGLITGALGVSLGVGISKTIEWGDRLDKLNLRIGASTEALSEYAYVAERSGVQFDQLTTGWQRQTRRIAEAAQGTGEAKKALDELGLSAQQLNKLAPEDQFEVIATALQGVANEQDRVRLAMRFWDSEGVSLLQIVNQGAEAMGEMRQEARELGLTMDRETATQMAAARDQVTRIEGAFQGLSLQLASDFGPTLVNLMGFVGDVVIPGFIELLETLGLLEEQFDRMTLKVAEEEEEKILGEIQTLVARIEAAPRSDLQAALLGVSPEAFGASGQLPEKLRELASNLAQVQARIRELKQPTDEAAQGARDFAGALGETGDNAGDAAEEVDKYIAALEGEIEAIGLSREQLVLLEAERIKALTTDELQRQKIDQLVAAYLREVAAQDASVAAARRVEEAKRTAADAQDRLTRMYREALGEVNPLAAATEEFGEKVFFLVQRLALGQISGEEFAEILALIKAQYEKTVAGMTESNDEAKKGLKDLEEAADPFAVAWERAIQRLDDAGVDMWENFLRTGKLNMDAVKDIFITLLAEMAHAALTRQIILSFGLSGGGGGFGQGALGLANAAGGGGGGGYGSGLFGMGSLYTGLGNTGVGLATLLGGPNAGSAVAGSAGGGVGFLGALALPLAGGALTAGAGRYGGAIGGAVGGFAAAGTTAGAAYLGSTALATGSAAALGAELGSVVPVIGTIIGAILGAAFGRMLNNNTNPSSQISFGQARGGQDVKLTDDFGGVFLGSGRDGFHEYKDEIAKPFQEFFGWLSTIVDESQREAITAALSGMGDIQITREMLQDGTFFEDSGVFDAVLGALNPSIKAFVEGVGDDFETQIRALNVGIQLEQIVDLTDLFDDLDTALEAFSGVLDMDVDILQVVGGMELLKAAFQALGLATDFMSQEFVLLSAEFVDAAGGLPRAQALWSSYFENFFTAEERAVANLERVKTAAEEQFTSIGLSIDDFTGSEGMQKFRTLFETVLPTLSGEAQVAWLMAADALGLVIDAERDLAIARGETADATNAATDAEVGGITPGVFAGGAVATLDIPGTRVTVGAPSGRTDGLYGMGPPTSPFGQLDPAPSDLYSLGGSTGGFGGTGSVRGTTVTVGAPSGETTGVHSFDNDPLADARQDYRDFIDGIKAETDHLSGASDTPEARIAAIQKEEQARIRAANELARAAGMEGASTEDLVIIHQWAATQIAAVHSDVQDALKTYDDFIGGIREETALLTGEITPLDAEIAAIRRQEQAYIDRANEYARAAGLEGAAAEDLAAIHAWAAAQIDDATDRLGESTTQLAAQVGLVQDVGSIVDPLERLEQALDSLRQRIHDFLDGLEFDDRLSPLTIRERFAEAEARYQELFAAAEAGDMSALEALPDAFQELLSLGSDMFTTTTDEYQALFDRRDAIRALADSFEPNAASIAEYQQLGGGVVGQPYYPANIGVANLVAEQINVDTETTNVDTGLAAIFGPPAPSLDPGITFGSGSLGPIFGPPAPGGTPEGSFDTGSAYIPKDMIAEVHKGEMIIDPRSSDVLRRYGISMRGEGGESARVLRQIRDEIRGQGSERSVQLELALRRLEDLVERQEAAAREMRQLRQAETSRSRRAPA